MSTHPAHLSITYAHAVMLGSLYPAQKHLAENKVGGSIASKSTGIHSLEGGAFPPFNKDVREFDPLTLIFPLKCNSLLFLLSNLEPQRASASANLIETPLP